MDVFTIGSKTHGKPVGMHGFEFQDWLLLPVVNFVANAEGFYDYFDGISVNKQTSEGLDKDWGDVTDPALYEALHYISYGTFGTRSYAYIKSTIPQLPVNLNVGRNLLLINR